MSIELYVPEDLNPPRLLTRSEATTLQQRITAPITCDLELIPPESGVGGCPWRIILCLILAKAPMDRRCFHLRFRKETKPEDRRYWYSRDRYANRNAMRALVKILEHAPTPEALQKQFPLDAPGMSYKLMDLIEECEVHGPGRRVRTILKFNTRWLSASWETVMDLPGMNKETLCALDAWTAPLADPDSAA